MSLSKEAHSALSHSVKRLAQGLLFSAGLLSAAPIIAAEAALMLAPGGVQIFYGDESGRLPGPASAADAQQATRSDMNWASLDKSLLEHWRKLGQFRLHHVALARGEHKKLSDIPYVFSREYAANGDRIVASPNARGEVQIPVGDVFAEGAKVIDAYSGQESVVVAGKVKLTADGVVLLEARHLP